MNFVRSAQQIKELRHSCTFYTSLCGHLDKKQVLYIHKYADASFFVSFKLLNKISKFSSTSKIAVSLVDTGNDESISRSDF